MQRNRSSFALVVYVNTETPMGLIAENLRKAREIAHSDSRVPEQLKHYLQKALEVAVGLDPYLDAMATAKK
ncbi:putative G-protein coupled receptor 149 [Platysternon megacephalum]|uniref:Putative G-protein coupled receptor 149 n=1 Tax=Platysternon megacephalum TaxID=55544 RepID=A0A4D9EM09_9SAUR|nr:putative G-protein coupled receptor 149 [Platysternon megacephalum]